jgi:histidinol phosphatase-like PHP family hydrolase
MQKKFQVFVSSTYEDLVEERQDALKSILDLGHIPAGMEGFFAADQEQFEYIKKIIDECDYYVLIIAGRYGSVDETELSYTEKEYDYAVSKGVTVLAFIHNDVSSLPAAKVDADPALSARLKAGDLQ